MCRVGFFVSVRSGSGRGSFLEGFVPDVSVGADVELGTEDCDFAAEAAWCLGERSEGYFDGVEEGVFEREEKLEGPGRGEGGQVEGGGG